MKTLIAEISAMSMQASLRYIDVQLENIGREVVGVIDFSRRENLSNSFKVVSTIPRGNSEDRGVE